MSSRADVFDVEAHQVRNEIRELAILAPSKCACANRQSQGFAHASLCRNRQSQLQPGAKLDQRKHF